MSGQTKAVDVDTDLIPADLAQCQAEHRRAHNAFTLGPVPQMARCKSAPDFLAVEIIPGDDGKRGSMSLCLACAKVMLEDGDLRTRVQLQPIQHTTGHAE